MEIGFNNSADVLGAVWHGMERGKDYNRFFENALPEADFKYASKSNAFCFVENAM